MGCSHKPAECGDAQVSKRDFGLSTLRALTGLRRIAAALLPEQCAGCGQTAAAGFCSVCVGAWPRVARPCARCGLETPVASCPRRAHAWTVATVVAPFSYAAPLEGYVHALKYRRERRLGRALGALLAADAADAVDAWRSGAAGAADAGVHALVPVPLAPRRLRERGYNQAFEIARTVGAALGLPVLTRGVARGDARSGVSRTQIGRGAAERHASVLAAFAVERNFAGLHVAIVDDVIPTGATVNALAQALETAGAARVDAWAVARTPAPGG
jgi:ComF family protein